MRRADGTMCLFHRLPHGGHVDLNLRGDGRVFLLLNSGADVAEVLHELDAVRDELRRFHLAVVRNARSTVSPAALEAALHEAGEQLTFNKPARDAA